MHVRQVFEQIRAKVILTLMIGATAGLVVGGAVHLIGGAGNGANAAAPPASNPPPTLGAAPLKHGAVVVDDTVSRLATEIGLGTTHTTDGAVAAFASYSAWLIGSPAAAADPAQAVQAVGSSLLNPADARELIRMQRGPEDAFRPSRGAYRVLGHSGEATVPSQVMIEVNAPLTLAGKTEWRVVGGVVSWTAAGWSLVSIQPRDVPQPSPEHDDVRMLTAQERTKTFAGLGWQLFAAAKGE